MNRVSHALKYHSKHLTNLLLVVSLCLVFSNDVSAQVLTHGPIIGGVTDTSANVYLRTGQQTRIRLEYCADSSFQADVRFLEAETQPELDTAQIFRLSGLLPGTHYYLRVRLYPPSQTSPKKDASGRVVRSMHDFSPIVIGRFQTLPAVGHVGYFHFAFGSCSDHRRSQKLFEVLGKYQPQLFLHLGDWTYADHDNYPYSPLAKTKNILYTLDYDKVKTAYRTRYEMEPFRKVLAHTAMDFLYDDDDFIIDGISRNTYSEVKVVNKEVVMTESPVPTIARANAFKGYRELFPGYNVPNPEDGNYHSYRFGNCEVFHLDVRACSTPNTSPLVKKGKKWHFVPVDTHSLLGPMQMQWLLDGLRSSTATWKFVVSGVNFNRQGNILRDLVLMLQGFTLPRGLQAAEVAAMLMSPWSGFPADQATLINTLAVERISNVLILSGDAHASAIDDGSRAGIAEFMSGNLAVENTKLPRFMDRILGYSPWNLGGQGLNGDRDTNDCFGHVEVMGNDSLQLSIINSENKLIRRVSLKSGFVPKPVSLKTLKGKGAGYRLFLLGRLFRLAGLYLAGKLKE